MSYRLSPLLLACLFVFQFEPREVTAQAQLRRTNPETTVERISYKFGASQSFFPQRLSQEIATTAPGFLYGIRNFFSFLPFISVSAHLLGPVELQRDVIRLRTFYVRQGFPHINVNFFASQFNERKNTVHVIFAVQEGQPLHVTEFKVEGLQNLPPSVEKRWFDQRRKIAFRDSSRYSDFESVRIQNEIVTFLQNGGYPFATVHSSAEIDSTTNGVHVVYTADTGSRARIDSVLIVGNESVRNAIVRRELPLSTGDYFSRERLSQGQSDLFAMNLFRFAIAEVPDQEPDSTVTIRYRVGESSRRSVTLSGGFSQEFGVSLVGTLVHRNFLGGARSATLSAVTETGRLANPGNGKEPRKSTKLSLSVRQPYIFKRGFSLTLSPFYTRLNDPNQNTDFYRLGATGTLLWRILEYRNATFEFTHSRSVPITGRGTNEKFDLYNVNSYALGFTLGRLDSYLNPSRGFLINPRWEASGTLFASGVDYRKGSISARYYVHVLRRSSLALSMNYGLLIPFAKSNNQNDPETEFRFDRIRFYAGGSNDVRGWGLNELGPQIARGDSIFFDPAGMAHVRNPIYEPVGGEAKLSGSAEYRFAFPGVPDAFRVGFFLDFGVLSARFKDRAVSTSFSQTSDLIDDNGSLHGSDFQFGTGGGIRYATPVGSVRFDLAYKLNPSFSDLRNPEDVILFQEGVTSEAPIARNGRRWRFHLSLDRSF